METTTSDARTVILADGRPASVRRMNRADRSSVTSLYAGTSQDNLYTRFFTIGQGAVARHIDHLFTPVDPPEVFLVEAAGRLLGVADVERCGGATSEIAFLVADDAHGLGIATLLLERVAEESRATGVEWLVADVLAVNHPMMSVFTDAGFTLELHQDHGEVKVRMSTAATPAAVAAARARHLRSEALAHPA
jgi:GNAT superfamily N-acetyltransferase